MFLGFDRKKTKNSSNYGWVGLWSGWIPMGLERSKPKVRRDRTSQPKMLDNFFFEDQNVDWRNLTPPTEKLALKTWKKGREAASSSVSMKASPFSQWIAIKKPFVILRWKFFFRISSCDVLRSRTDCSGRYIVTFAVISNLWRQPMTARNLAHFLINVTRCHILPQLCRKGK